MSVSCIVGSSTDAEAVEVAVVVVLAAGVGVGVLAVVVGVSFRFTRRQGDPGYATGRVGQTCACDTCPVTKRLAWHKAQSDAHYVHHPKTEFVVGVLVLVVVVIVALSPGTFLRKEGTSLWRSIEGPQLVLRGERLSGGLDDAFPKVRLSSCPPISRTRNLSGLSKTQCVPYVVPHYRSFYLQAPRYIVS